MKGNVSRRTVGKQNAIIQLKINELPSTVIPSSSSCASLLTANGKALGLCHVLKNCHVSLVTINGRTLVLCLKSDVHSLYVINVLYK